MSLPLSEEADQADPKRKSIQLLKAIRRLFPSPKLTAPHGVVVVQGEPLPANVIQFGRSLCTACRRPTLEVDLEICDACNYATCDDCGDQCRCATFPPMNEILLAAEYALRRDNLIATTVADHIEARNVLAIKDERGRYLYACPTMERIAGATYMEMKGKLSEHFLSDEICDRLNELDTIVLRTNRPQSMIARVVLDGEVQFWQIRKTLMVVGGNKFTICAWKNVTQEPAHKAS